MLPEYARMFEQAEIFRIAAYEIDRAGNEPGRDELKYASPVLEALAFELYLKCLLGLRGLLAGSEYAKRHSLALLFGALPLKDQQRIRVEACAGVESMDRRMDALRGQPGMEGIPPQVDFDFLLQASDRAFESFRYAHEGIPPRSGWLAASIAHATRQMIVAEVGGLTEIERRLMGG